MKKLQLNYFALFILFTVNINAQTNTFPTSGKVGIGSIFPSAELEVKSLTNDNAEIHINSSTDGKPSIIRFQDAGTNTWGLLSNYPNTDKLSIYNYHNTSNAMVFDIEGNVGIGTINPTEKLTVNGKILCEEVEVILDVPAADYVFEKYYNGYSNLKADYVMPTLEEVENYTKANHHLQEVPSAATLKEDGLQIKEMSMILLQKIEELTLYTIEQEKRIKALEAQIVK
ncbi:MAG: hypothetical protein ABJL44_13045 [Algibacter sp.]